MKYKLPHLQKGDSVGLVATARKVSPEEMQPFKNWVAKQGWNLIEAKNLYKSDRQFAGTDKERASDMNEMLSNPEIKAIFCARGGYGTVRILEQVDFNLLLQNPKWLCGFSDVTVLHQHLFHKLNHFPSLHSMMAISFHQYKESEWSEPAALLANILRGKQLSFNLPENFTQAEGLEGVISGGNLSVLYSLLGSESLDSFKDCILFLEDLDEYLYHVDRMMIALKRAGVFNGVKAVIAGGLTAMNDNAIPFGKTAEAILSEHFNELNIPFYTGFPSGHLASNFPIPFGYVLKISQNKATFTAI
jgi:muramoyltetrapeptide carboxypeptidase